MNDLEKKKYFLINKPEYIITRMSQYYPFTWAQLKKYKTILNWNSICKNEQMKWSIGRIREFKDWLSQANIERDFGWLTANTSVPWSIELIEEFKEYWFWDFFGCNEKVIANASIRNYFQAELAPYLTEQVISDMIDKYFGFGEYGRNHHFVENIHDQYIECGIKFKERMYQTIDEIESEENIDWGILSGNLLLPWSIELIEKYKDKWCWRSLCRNEMIPWNEKLIEHFKDKIVWGKWVELDFYCKRIFEGLSNNKAMNWNSKLINRYRDNLEFRELSRNKATLWNIDLLIELQDFWCYEALPLNNAVWNKVFFEFDDSEILKTLDIVLKTKLENKPTFKFSFEKN